MKNRIALVLSGIVLLTANSCLEDFLFVNGSGHIETELRRPGSFDRIDNTTSFDIIYRKADTSAVSITTDDNILDHIVTEVCNNRLEIRTRPLGVILDCSKHPVIIVTSPRIDEANLSGSGSLTADKISGNSVSVKLSGSGNINVDSINCTNLTAMISGSGDISVKYAICTHSDISASGSGIISVAGKCDTEHARISGSGKIDGRYFLVNSADLSISGSGDVYGNVKDYLNATISGSGDIYLYGNPRIDQKRSGSGKIRKQ
jgi:cytoskeletal protein CcmA (bactofilin family)